MLMLGPQATWGCVPVFCAIPLIEETTILRDLPFYPFQDIETFLGKKQTILCLSGYMSISTLQLIILHVFWIQISNDDYDFKNMGNIN